MTLKPCPFCGSDEELEHDVGAICCRCGAQGPFADAEVDAQLAWNTRFDFSAPDPDAIAAREQDGQP